MACPLCGTRFDPAAARSGCAERGCPLDVNCEKICCPNCGYGMVVESGLTRALGRLFGGRAGKADDGR